MTILPGFVTRHWQLKLSALGMAVLLWTVPGFEAPTEEVHHGVTVVVPRNDTAYALLGTPDPPTIRVTLSGPAGELSGWVGSLFRSPSIPWIQWIRPFA